MYTLPILLFAVLQIAFGAVMLSCRRNTPTHLHGGHPPHLGYQNWTLSSHMIDRLAMLYNSFLRQLNRFDFFPA